MSILNSIKRSISDSFDASNRKSTVDQNVKVDKNVAESIFMSQFDINKTNLTKKTKYEEDLLAKKKAVETQRKKEEQKVEEIMESKDETQNPICPFCETTSKMTTSKEFYNTNTDYNTCVYYCPNCPDVYVNSKPGTTVPYGEMTNAEGRMYRKLTHKLTDIKKKEYEFDNAFFYKWVADSLNIKKRQVTFASLSIAKCKELISVVNDEVYESRYAYIFDTYPDEDNIPNKYL